MKPTLLRSARRSFPLASAIAALLGAPAVMASTFYWNTTTTGTWATGANWSDDPTTGGITGIVPSSADSAVFNQSGVNGALTVQLDEDHSINGITFGNTGTTQITSDSATPRTLTLGSGGLAINSGAGAVTLGDATNVMNLSLDATQAWTNDSSNTLTVINNISLANAGAQTLTITGSGNSSLGGVAGDGSGTLGLTKSGIGTLTLSGANTYSGITYINEGTLKIGNAAALGTQTGTTDGTIIASGATLDLGGIGSGASNQAGSVGTERITASGAGVGGNGAILSSTQIPSNFIGVRHLTLAGNTTLGFTNRWDVGSNNNLLPSSLVGGGHTLNIVGSGSGQASFNYLGETDLGDININLGSGAGNIVYLQGDTTLGRAANTVTISGGSTLYIFNNSTVASFDKKFALNTGNIATNKGGGVSLPGTMSLSGATNIITADGGSVAITASGAISGTGALTKAGAGRLTLSNANNYTGGTIVSAGVLNLTNTNTFGVGGITVGNVSGKAVLNLSGSANVSIAGGVSASAGQTRIGTVTGANGALNISAGTFSSTTTGGGGIDNNFLFGAATGGYGYLNISGVSTSVTAHRWQFGGGASTAGTGVGLISGGTSNIREFLLLGRNSGGLGSVTITGSSTIVNHLAVGGGAASSNISLAYVSGATGVLNMQGGTLNSAGRNLTVREGNSGSGVATGIINLNGGTVTVNAITASGTSGTNHLSYLNFNGGTLKAGAATQTLIPANLTGNYVNSSGGTIDNGGLAGITVAGNLLAPAGNGVTNIAVTDGGSGYIGAPFVAISGSGAAATAIANMVDDGTGNGTFRIGSFTVTNPGVNYIGAPTLTLTGGGPSTSATIGTVTTAALSSGGMTFTGAGTTILSGVSNYIGATAIKNGTLALSVGNDRLPTGTTVTLGDSVANTNGILKLDSRSQQLAGLVTAGAGTGNRVVNSNAAAATLTLNIASGTNTFGGILGGGGANESNFALTKSGNGTLTFSGLNTYTGATAVNAGTLNITSTGSTAASSAVTVSNSGTALVVDGTVNGTLLANVSTTLSGTGTVNGAATVNGTHNPGSSPGIQTFTNGLTYGSTATLNAEFVGNTLGLRGTDFDGVNVTGGNLTINSLATLALYTSSIDYSDSLWDSARAFTVIEHSGAGTSTGSFTLNTTNAGLFAAEGSWGLANSSNDIILSWTPVPEPSVAALMGVLGGFLLLRRRR